MSFSPLTIDNQTFATLPALAAYLDTTTYAQIKDKLPAGFKFSMELVHALKTDNTGFLKNMTAALGQRIAGDNTPEALSTMSLGLFLVLQQYLTVAQVSSIAVAQELDKTLDLGREVNKVYSLLDAQLVYREIPCPKTEDTAAFRNMPESDLAFLTGMSGNNKYSSEVHVTMAGSRYWNATPGNPVDRNHRSGKLHAWAAGKRYGSDGKTTGPGHWHIPVFTFEFRHKILLPSMLLYSHGRSNVMQPGQDNPPGNSWVIEGRSDDQWVEIPATVHFNGSETYTFSSTTDVPYTAYRFIGTRGTYIDHWFFEAELVSAGTGYNAAQALAAYLDQVSYEAIKDRLPRSFKFRMEIVNQLKTDGTGFLKNLSSELASRIIEDNMPDGFGILSLPILQVLQPYIRPAMLNDTAEEHVIGLLNTPKPGIRWSRILAGELTGKIMAAIVAATNHPDHKADEGFFFHLDHDALGSIHPIHFRTFGLPVYKSIFGRRSVIDPVSGRNVWKAPELSFRDFPKTHMAMIQPDVLHQLILSALHTPDLDPTFKIELPIGFLDKLSDFQLKTLRPEVIALLRPAHFRFLDITRVALMLEGYSADQVSALPASVYEEVLTGPVAQKLDRFGTANIEPESEGVKERILTQFAYEKLLTWPWEGIAFDAATATLNLDELSRIFRNETTERISKEREGTANALNLFLGKVPDDKKIYLPPDFFAKTPATISGQNITDLNRIQGGNMAGVTPAQAGLLRLLGARDASLLGSGSFFRNIGKAITYINPLFFKGISDEQLQALSPDAVHALTFKQVTALGGKVLAFTEAQAKMLRAIQVLYIRKDSRAAFREKVTELRLPLMRIEDMEGVDVADKVWTLVNKPGVQQSLLNQLNKPRLKALIQHHWQDMTGETRGRVIVAMMRKGLPFSLLSRQQLIALDSAAAIAILKAKGDLRLFAHYVTAVPGYGVAVQQALLHQGFYHDAYRYMARYREQAGSAEKYDAQVFITIGDDYGQRLGSLAYAVRMDNDVPTLIYRYRDTVGIPELVDVIHGAKEDELHILQEKKNVRTYILGRGDNSGLAIGSLQREEKTHIGYVETYNVLDSLWRKLSPGGLQKFTRLSLSGCSLAQPPATKDANGRVLPVQPEDWELRFTLSFLGKLSALFFASENQAYRDHLMLSAFKMPITTGTGISPAGTHPAYARSHENKIVASWNGTQNAIVRASKGAQPGGRNEGRLPQLIAAEAFVLPEEELHENFVHDLALAYTASEAPGLFTEDMRGINRIAAAEALLFSVEAIEGATKKVTVLQRNGKDGDLPATHQVWDAAALVSGDTAPDRPVKEKGMIRASGSSAESRLENTLYQLQKESSNVVVTDLLSGITLARIGVAGLSAGEQAQVKALIAAMDGNPDLAVFNKLKQKTKSVIQALRIQATEKVSRHHDLAQHGERLMTILSGLTPASARQLLADKFHVTWGAGNTATLDEYSFRDALYRADTATNLHLLAALLQLTEADSKSLLAVLSRSEDLALRQLGLDAEHQRQATATAKSGLATHLVEKGAAALNAYFTAIGIYNLVNGWDTGSDARQGTDLASLIGSAGTAAASFAVMRALQKTVHTMTGAGLSLSQSVATVMKLFTGLDFAMTGVVMASMGLEWVNFWKIHFSYLGHAYNSLVASTVTAILFATAGLASAASPLAASLSATVAASTLGKPANTAGPIGLALTAATLLVCGVIKGAQVLEEYGGYFDYRDASVVLHEGDEITCTDNDTVYWDGQCNAKLNAAPSALSIVIPGGYDRVAAWRRGTELVLGWADTADRQTVADLRQYPYHNNLKVLKTLAIQSDSGILSLMDSNKKAFTLNALQVLDATPMLLAHLPKTYVFRKDSGGTAATPVKIWADAGINTYTFFKDAGHFSLQFHTAHLNQLMLDVQGTAVEFKKSGSGLTISCREQNLSLTIGNYATLHEAQLLRLWAKPPGAAYTDLVALVLPDPADLPENIAICCPGPASIAVPQVISPRQVIDLNGLTADREVTAADLAAAGGVLHLGLPEWADPARLIQCKSYKYRSKDLALYFADHEAREGAAFPPMLFVREAFLPDVRLQLFLHQDRYRAEDPAVAYANPNSSALSTEKLYPGDKRHGGLRHTGDANYYSAQVNKDPDIDYTFVLTVLEGDCDIAVTLTSQGKETIQAVSAYDKAGDPLVATNQKSITVSGSDIYNSIVYPRIKVFLHPDNAATSCRYTLKVILKSEIIGEALPVAQNYCLYPCVDPLPLSPTRFLGSHDASDHAAISGWGCKNHFFLFIVFFPNKPTDPRSETQTAEWTLDNTTAGTNSILELHGTFIFSQLMLLAAGPDLGICIARQGNDNEVERRIIWLKDYHTNFAARNLRLRLLNYNNQYLDPLFSLPVADPVSGWWVLPAAPRVAVMGPGTFLLDLDPYGERTTIWVARSLIGSLPVDTSPDSPLYGSCTLANAEQLNYDLRISNDKQTLYIRNYYHNPHAIRFILLDNSLGTTQEYPSRPDDTPYVVLPPEITKKIPKWSTCYRVLTVRYLIPALMEEFFGTAVQRALQSKPIDFNLLEGQREPGTTDNMSWPFSAIKAYSQVHGVTTGILKSAVFAQGTNVTVSSSYFERWRTAKLLVKGTKGKMKEAAIIDFLTTYYSSEAFFSRTKGWLQTEEQCRYIAALSQAGVLPSIIIYAYLKNLSVPQVMTYVLHAGQQILSDFQLYAKGFSAIGSVLTHDGEQSLSTRPFDKNAAADKQLLRLIITGMGYLPARVETLAAAIAPLIPGDATARLDFIRNKVAELDKSLD